MEVPATQKVMKLFLQNPALPVLELSKCLNCWNLVVPHLCIANKLQGECGGLAVGLGLGAVRLPSIPSATQPCENQTAEDKLPMTACLSCHHSLDAIGLPSSHGWEFM